MGGRGEQSVKILSMVFVVKTVHRMYSVSEIGHKTESGFDIKLKE